MRQRFDEVVGGDDAERRARLARSAPTGIGASNLSPPKREPSPGREQDADDARHRVSPCRDDRRNVDSTRGQRHASVLLRQQAELAVPDVTSTRARSSMPL